MQLSGEGNQSVWAVAPHADVEFLRSFADLHPLLIQVLWARGKRTRDAIYATIEGESPAQSAEMLDMGRAVERIACAITHGEKIAIYGDYDCDGVTACVLLKQIMDKLNAITQVYIPDRFEEGYGLNAGALDKLNSDGVTLVITVDCGSRAINEAIHAKRIGLDLIITDHHDLADGLPDAFAVINPKRADCPYPFKQMAGVGVAYRLAQALLKHFGYDDDFAQQFKDLVAIGTIADVMPLVGENRDLVRDGLKQINMHARVGVVALAHTARLNPTHINAGNVAFQLAPRLNAAGRIDSALNAYDLLMTTNEAWASDLAGALDHRNEQRQQITNAVVRSAEARIREGVFKELDPVKTPQVLVDDAPKPANMQGLDVQSLPLLFVASTDYNAGVIGLAAARLAERYTRPSIVVHINGDEARGSCRSVEGFHITNALDTCKPLLLKHGGHAAAAGFTTKIEWLESLKAQLHVAAQQSMPENGWQKTLYADAEINLHKLNVSSYNALQQLEPHGHGNLKPTFVARKVEIRAARGIGRPIGEADEAHAPHLKLTLRDQRGGQWDAIGWRMGERLAEFGPGGCADLAFQIEMNEWNGQQRLQLILQDMKSVPR